MDSPVSPYLGRHRRCLVWRRSARRRGWAVVGNSIRAQIIAFKVSGGDFLGLFSTLGEVGYVFLVHENPSSSFNSDFLGLSPWEHKG